MGFFRLLSQRVQGFADQLAGAIYIRVCNVQIKHGSYSIRSGRQHVNSQAVPLLNKLTCGDASQPEANNVRLDRCGIDVDFRVGSDLEQMVKEAILIGVASSVTRRWIRFALRSAVVFMTDSERRHSNFAERLGYIEEV